MLDKLFRQLSFQILIHLLIVVGILSNGYYILENYKITRNNQKIEEQNSLLEQDKKNLLSQNSYEFLDTYKDKIIKRSGFKKSDEQIFDVSKIDVGETEKNDKITGSSIPNQIKWYNCLFVKNTKLIDEEKNSLFCR